jgi:hypothetical protein
MLLSARRGLIDSSAILLAQWLARLEGGIAMTQPAWLARAVLYHIDVPRFADANGGGLDGVTAYLSYCTDLGVNALALGGCFAADPGAAAPTRIDPRYGDEASFDALLGAAHARGIRVCIATTSSTSDRGRARDPNDADGGPGVRDAWQRALEAWFDRGVDGVLVTRDDDGGDAYHVVMHRLWRDLRAWSGSTYGERALLVDVGHPRVAADAGLDVELARPDDPHGGDALATGANALAATRSVGAAANTHDTDDLKALFTFLLTWSHTPCIRYGDEIGARSDGVPTVAMLRARKEPLWHHVERLIYLRVTETDLGTDAASTVLGGGRGQPLLYRRGATLIVALNPGLTTHVVVLPPVGDVAPVLEHHCHASHGPNGWQLKIGARGYGVFTVR